MERWQMKWSYRNRLLTTLKRWSEKIIRICSGIAFGERNNDPMRKIWHKKLFCVLSAACLITLAAVGRKHCPIWLSGIYVSTDINGWNRCPRQMKYWRVFLLSRRIKELRLRTGLPCTGTWISCRRISRRLYYYGTIRSCRSMRSRRLWGSADL